MRIFPCSWLLNTGAVMNMMQRDENIAPVAKWLRDAHKSLPPCRQTSHLGTLIDTCAWTDAAIALMSQELPTWTLRRLMFEDGIWHCSLSRTPFIPFDLDDTADGSGSSLAFAILRAIAEARRRPQLSSEPNITSDSVPSFLSSYDNFI